MPHRFLFSNYGKCVFCDALTNSQAFVCCCGSAAFPHDTVLEVDTISVSVLPVALAL